VHGFGTHRQAGSQCKQPRPEGPLGFQNPFAFRELDVLFAQAELQIALLQRAWPERARAQCERWIAAVRRGEAIPLTFCYRPPPRLTALRAALDGVAAALARESVPAEAGPATLYAERALELELEAALAEAIGTPGFTALARRRHSIGRTSEWHAAERRAREWASAPELEQASSAVEPCFASDDASSALSLVSVLREQVGRLRLPVRVQVVHELASRAATGEGVIYVRAAERLSGRESLRIARHEVFAHALPRVRARQHPLGLLRVGCAGAAEDEEGRALVLEQRFGDLGPERRRELGLRHLAALAVADGADAHACVRRLEGFGCGLEQAVALYARSARGAAARGGGLCRELEYLPAWLRVGAAFAAVPRLERWLEQGRASLRAARALEAGPALQAHSNVANTGT
jgi:Domain of unknown function (DUF1704)